MNVSGLYWIVFCRALSPTLHLREMALKCRLLKIFFHLREMTRNSEVDKTETGVRRIFVGYLF